jgi:hypothetical protein
VKEKLLPLINDKKNRLLLLAFFAVGILLIFHQFSNSTDSDRQSHDVFTADTIIPKGFVLVPVEIQNIDSLKDLIGNFAIVDLFTTTQVQQKGGIKVGRRIRLIRAPLNPQSYAVLIPESEAHQLLESQGPFTAVIQNPANQQPTEISKSKVTVSTIEYLKGGRHD